MDLKSQLKDIINGDVIDSNLDKYSKDASIFEVTPQIVVAPKDSEDIKSLVKFVSSNSGLSLTARSAGTDMSGGPLSDSLVLEMTKYFNQVLEVGEDYAITQPGVFYRDFEIETLKKNLLLPCYTASREICTVGGMVANNSAGEKTLKYGQTERYVENLKVVLADGNEYQIRPLNKLELAKKLTQKDFEGEIYRKIFKLITSNLELIQEGRPKVSKNAAGYNLWTVWDGQTFDLTKLLTGSQGTLGIITEIKFKLIPPATYSKMLVIFLDDLTNLGVIVNKILEAHPESFESYDDYTLKFALKYLPEVIKVLRPKNLLSLLFRFIPEEWMNLTHHFPKLVLIAEFTGNSEEEVLNLSLQAQNYLKEFNLTTKITKDAEEARKYWTIRRESFGLLKRHAQNLYASPFIDDIIVKPDYLPEFLPKLRSILNEYQIIYTMAGHIGNGNFHIIPLLDFQKNETAKIIADLSEKVFNLVFSYHGSMSGEHNDGLIRSHYLKRMYGEKMFSLFKEIKFIFDPKNIFNPHKKTDGDFTYSFSHLIKTHQVLHHPNS